ncbi:hypothetical protein CSA56_12885 [candidate division KSB3 bacterium]|uniref:Ice-binding protein C-terminal domain-containing protein n=1 Tax=candidate division KSB3 bacterium TaxID=2044937 RepID=A0A2G6KC17_9BACT|nr:MAG: hypothetical protein CSA56_12885 [candidate division KSB3 bacterium]
MKKFMTVMVVAMCMVGVAKVYALDLGKQITINDNKSRGGYSGWWDGRNGHGDVGEDQEVEPGMQRGQNWDLEGFFLNEHTLSMVGGFDFINGYQTRTSGDLFLDVDGDVAFGDNAPATGLKRHGNKKINNKFGYDYVLDLNFTDFTYDIYEIDKNSKVTMGYYRQNDTSTAWAYESGGTKIGSGLIGYEQGLSDAEAGGFRGGSHNVASVDLGFLSPGTSFTSHFTMSCGNDNLMGYGTTPDTPVATPEPGTLLLLGVGMVGLVSIARKRRS